MANTDSTQRGQIVGRCSWHLTTMLFCAVAVAANVLEYSWPDKVQPRCNLDRLRMAVSVY